MRRNISFKYNLKHSVGIFKPIMFSLNIFVSIILSGMPVN